MVVVGLKRVSSWVGLLFQGAGCPSPGFGSWDELESVLGVVTVAFVYLLKECWALPAPAGMAVSLAGDACFPVGVGSLAGLVVP